MKLDPNSEESVFDFVSKMQLENDSYSLKKLKAYLN